jgi:hypothetical protein
MNSTVKSTLRLAKLMALSLLVARLAACAAPADTSAIDDGKVAAADTTEE